MLKRLVSPEEWVPQNETCISSEPFFVVVACDLREIGLFHRSPFQRHCSHIRVNIVNIFTIRNHGIFMGILSLELWSHTASSTTTAAMASFKHQSSTILMPWDLLLQVSGVEFHIDLATWSKNRLPEYCHLIPQWKMTSVTSIEYENTPTVAQLQMPKYKS